MRKTFKLFCAAALAALAVSSCGKIWDEFDSVHGELDDLKAKVEALEKKLNDEVATLNTKIGALESADKDLKALITANSTALALLNEELDALDGVVDGYITSNDAALKAAIEEYKKGDAALKDVDTQILAALAGVNVINVAKNEEGNVVITFADKSTIEVPANPATGIVTVVDGKWAVVVDGEVTVLEADVNPDTELAFKVVENVLNVSYDGGKTWTPTGAVVNDKTTINVVEGFKYTEGDPYLTLTVGGKEYTLPVYKADTSSLVLGRTDFFLMYGASKEVELKAEGVEEYYVMSKPDGWKASFEGTTLTVVAPEKKTYEVGAAEAEGEILIHATTAEGKCKVAKLDVETGDGITLAIDRDGNVTIKNAFVGMSGNEEIGYTYGFQNFAVGIVPVAEFFDEEYLYAYEEMFGTTDPYVGFEKGFGFQMPGEPLFGVSGNYYNNVASGEYKDGVYEVDIINTDINTIYSDVLFSPYTDWEAEEPNFDLPYGAYIVWVASLDENGIVGGMRFTEYLNVKVDVELVSASYNDIKVKVSVAGADEYMIGYIPASEMNMGGHGPGPLSSTVVDFKDFDEYMLSSRGPWKMFAENGVTYYLAPQFGQQMPAEYVPEMLPEDGFMLSSFNNSGEKLQFNETYYFWVMPMFNHMSKFDEMTYNYDFSAYGYEKHFKPYVSVFTTNDIQKGGKCEPEITFDEISYTSFSAAVTAEDADVVYYAIFNSETYSNLSNDQETVDAVLAACEWPEYGSFDQEFDRDAGYTTFESGSKYYLAVVAIDSEGKYTLVVEDCETLTFPTTVNEAYTVTFGDVVKDYSKVTVPVTPSAVGTTYYMFYNKSVYDNKEAADVMNELLVDGTLVAEATDIVKSNASPATDYVLAVLVLGADGKDYNVITKTCSTKSYPYDETNIKLSLKSLTSSEKDQYTAVFSVEGASDIMYQIGSEGYAANFPFNVVKYAPTQNTNYNTYEYASVSNNEVTITFESSTSFFDYSSDIYVVAYNVTDGSVSSMSKVLTFAVADKFEELSSAE